MSSCIHKKMSKMINKNVMDAIAVLMDSDKEKQYTGVCPMYIRKFLEEYCKKIRSLRISLRMSLE